MACDVARSVVRTHSMLAEPKRLDMHVKVSKRHVKALGLVHVGKQSLCAWGLAGGLLFMTCLAYCLGMPFSYF